MKLRLVKSNRGLFRHELESALEERGLGEGTGKEVLNVLFDEYGRGRSDFTVKYRYPEEVDSKLHHRINTLWVYPLFFLIAPFRYLWYGQYKVQEGSFGEKVLTWLLGRLG